MDDDGALFAVPDVVPDFRPVPGLVRLDVVTGRNPEHRAAQSAGTPTGTEPGRRTGRGR